MTETEVFIKQTKDAYLWVQQLIDTVPDDKWDEIPEAIQTNISWQIGHLIISIYYHSILVTQGHQTEVLNHIPIKKYSELYSLNSIPEKSSGAFSPDELKTHFKFIERQSIKTITSLSPTDLKNSLVPGTVEHPIAKNKFEALDWNIKHVMWHCGQIAILKRILGNVHQFQLKNKD